MELLGLKEYFQSFGALKASAGTVALDQSSEARRVNRIISHIDEYM